MQHFGFQLAAEVRLVWRNGRAIGMANEPQITGIVQIREHTLIVDTSCQRLRLGE